MRLQNVRKTPAPYADQPLNLRALDAAPRPAPSRGRKGADVPSDFDEQLYLALNPELGPALENGDFPSAIWHWEHQGRAEERAGTRPTIQDHRYYTVPAGHDLLPPSPDELSEFDAVFYLRTNPDVGAVVGGDHAAALEHWVRHGRMEGRPGCKGPGARPRRLVPGRLTEKPFGVNFFAPLSARSGLGAAARGYLRALRAANIPVHIVNIDFSKGHARIAVHDYVRRPPYRMNLVQVNADTLDRFVGLFRRDWFDDAYTIAIWAWELNILRPDWYSAFGMIDEVWALSRYNARAVEAIAPVPVRTMNPAVVAGPPAKLDRAYFNLPSGFIFLTAFDVGSSIARKNPGAVIDAFLQTFADRTDVHLLIKFHSSVNDAESVQLLLEKVHQASNIIVRSELLIDDEMRALQGCADCLVSAHRAEGFGLNLAEFMLTGKPVIATGYSGNLDFTEPSNSYLLPVTMVAIECASGPYLPGYLWAEPDRAALASTMRRVVENPAEARGIGARGAATIRKRLSSEIVGRRMTARFKELELHRPPPAFMRYLGRSAGLVPPSPGIVSPVMTRAELAARPIISIIVPVYDTPPEYLTACIESVCRQTYPHWELCLCDDASTDAGTRAVLARYQGVDPRIRIRLAPRNQGIAAASNEAVSMATGGWLLMLDHDDELVDSALAEVASVLVRDPTIDVVYGDEDKLDPSGKRCDPYHKPDWSPEHIESVMYTLHPLTVRTSLFLRLGGFREAFSGAQDWDLMLRLSRVTKAIHHIPKILYHWRMIPGSAAAAVDAKPEALSVGARALADHVAVKYGKAAQVLPAPLAGHYRVRHPIRGTPPVTIVITTDNRTLELPDRQPFSMVENLVTSIIEKTDYCNHRILVVDNANTPDALRRWYVESGVALHAYSGSARPFNYSDKANFAMRLVETEHVVVLNDDMEVIGREWLTALLEFSQQPGIGACGGKLLHADGTIQHVGTVLGVGGGSAHVYHGFPGDFVGYNGYTHVIRNYTALTGACLATRRSVLNEVGGWDPRLAIDYNDVDLCLRMRRHGYRLVYTPYSTLYHFESKTAVRTAQNPAEVDLFRTRWKATVDNDPFYNPNLSRVHHDFSLRAGQSDPAGLVGVS